MRRFISAAAVVAALAVPGAASAAFQTFEATIKNVTGDDALLVYLGIEDSRSLTARFRIDTDRATGAVETDGPFGGKIFTTKDAFTSFSLIAPDETIVAPGTGVNDVVSIDVVDPGLDTEDEFGITGTVPSPNGADGFMSIAVKNFDDGWSRSSPLTAAILNNFDKEDGFLLTLNLGGSEPSVVASDDITFAVVPVPAALPMFAAAIAGLGVAGWRKRKAA